MQEIIERDSYCELVLFNRHKIEIGRAKFDKRHKEAVASRIWNLHHSGAPRTQRERLYLHQLILGKRDGFVIDHVNGDRLDNLDTNLRHATPTQNSRNLPLSKRNRSGKKGVWWDAKNNSWQVKICVDRKQLFLGRFKSFEVACRVRDEAERTYYGEFSRGIMRGGSPSPTSELIYDAQSALGRRPH